MADQSRPAPGEDGALLHNEKTEIEELAPHALLSALDDARPVTVVVPVRDDGLALRDCLSSLRRFTPRHHRVVVVDDASSDPTTLAALADCTSTLGMELARHKTPQGYHAAVSHGVNLSGGDDVVVLHADTVVGPLWLNRLRWVAYSHADVASVTAGCDDTGATGLPRPWQDDDWGAHLSWAEVARHAAVRTRTWAQRVPAGHGICMYLRRSALERVGGLTLRDERGGAGDEISWSARADAEGMQNLYAPHVLVQHLGTSFADASGGIDGSDLTSRCADKLESWLSSSELADIRREATRVQARGSQLIEVKPVRLYVAHRTGAEPTQALDLTAALADDQTAYVIETNRHSACELSVADGSTLRGLERWRPAVADAAVASEPADYAGFVTRVLVERNVELVHVLDLGHDLATTVPEVCRRLEIPYIVTAHDLRDLWPPQDGGDDPAPEWHEEVSAAIDAAEHVVTATDAAAAALTANFPQIEPKLRVLEHGWSIEQFRVLRRSDARLPGPLRVLAPASWGPQAGEQYVRQLADCLGSEVEWHLLGPGAETLADVGIVHGSYSRDNLQRLSAEIDPDLIGIFSVAPETHTHTLAEAWAMGVPVVATDLGAPSDRVRAFGGGLLLPPEAPEAAAEQLRELAEAPERLPEILGPVPRESIRHTRTMANEYRELYGRVADVHPLRIGILDKGAARAIPPSAYVRVYRRARNLEFDGRAQFERLHAHDYAVRNQFAPLDVLVVVRDAVAPDLLQRVLRRARADGTRVVVDLDDDLITPSAMDRLVKQGYESARLAALRVMITEADATVASTAVLASRLGDLGVDATVVPNALDPRLWACDVEQVEPPGRQDELRLLYMGSPTHSEDLALLDGVMERVSESLGRRVVLELVGITKQAGTAGTRRLQPSRTDYVGFVAWLRERAARWCAAVAPLDQTPFNEAKSDLKLLEYSLLGLPIIASEVGPYADPHSVPAVRVANSTDAWAQAVLDVLTNPEQARELAGRAEKWTLSHRMMSDAGNAAWLDVVTGKPGNHHRA